MKQTKTFGELWEEGKVSGCASISDDDLLALAERTEIQLARHKPGSLMVRRRGGRPRNGTDSLPTALRSIRTLVSIWELVSNEADALGISTNALVEEAMIEKIQKSYTLKANQFIHDQVLIIGGNQTPIYTTKNEFVEEDKLISLGV
jgi:hypothetical protein